VIVDGSQGTATMDPSAGTVVNCVDVEVHNRGVVEAASMWVIHRHHAGDRTRAPLGGLRGQRRRRHAHL